jgi:hypothetical protein
MSKKRFDNVRESAKVMLPRQHVPALTRSRKA